MDTFVSPKTKTRRGDNAQLARVSFVDDLKDAPVAKPVADKKADKAEAPAKKPAVKKTPAKKETK